MGRLVEREDNAACHIVGAEGVRHLTIEGCGFLGLGLPPPDPDWGGMISQSR